MSDQKSGKKKQQHQHILLLVFWGCFLKKGEHTNLPRVFTLGLEDSKSAIRDHQIRIGLKTSENVLRWGGWIIGKRQDPIRIINPNPGIQRKIDEFQTYSILPLSHIWSFTKKRKIMRKVSKGCFSKLFRIISGDFFMSYSSVLPKKPASSSSGCFQNSSGSFQVKNSGFRCRWKTVGWTPSHFSHFFGFFPPLADLDPEDPSDPFSSGSKRRSSATTSGKALWTSWHSDDRNWKQKWGKVYEVTRFPCHVQHVLCWCHVQFPVQLSFRRRRHHHHHLIESNRI